MVKLSTIACATINLSKGSRMMKRQIDESRSVSRFNRQNQETVLEYGAIDKACVRFVEHIFADGDLDGEFPIRCRADLFAVVRILNRFARGGAQSRVSQSKPQQSIGIEEQVHCM
jgi:hypothetical protein